MTINLKNIFTWRNFWINLGITFVILGFYITYTIQPVINQNLVLYNLEKNYNSIKQDSLITQNINLYSKQNFSQFKEYINQTYTSSDKFDCKYWTYVWTVWVLRHQYEYNLDYEYIDTTNHIFIMISDETGYCILDRNFVDCFGMESLVK